ncbi:uncharacterized protein PgNI_00161 [Pyricularia grisea]|uniref:Ribosomal RNA methyltransferase FtsJ domain-containing protein n=1 Tax=Pyricularia grisea TaxID=148305 RepID=A0A6P8BJB1_PYRGI|nr:uncharacterized protein PgNI_00161 [Pyricularia grisea]TLD16780.1 hypothetical protein PgNI_00161 [Pyricularia grisea]
MFRQTTSSGGDTIKAVLLKLSPDFEELCKLRTKVATIRAADALFDGQAGLNTWQTTRHPERLLLDILGPSIAALDAETDILNIPSKQDGTPPRVLDLTPAPSAFTVAAARRNPHVLISGLVRPGAVADMQEVREYMDNPRPPHAISEMALHVLGPDAWGRVAPVSMTDRTRQPGDASGELLLEAAASRVGLLQSPERANVPTIYTQHIQDVVRISDEAVGSSSEVSVIRDAAMSATDPFQGQRFDFVFASAGGEVGPVRTMARRHYDALRDKKLFHARREVKLQAAQLILGLKRLRAGGRLVVMFRKVEAWSTIRALLFLAYESSLAGGSASLHKSVDGPSGTAGGLTARMEAARSGFYLVVRRCTPISECGAGLVSDMMARWKAAAVGSDELFVSVEDCPDAGGAERIFRDEEFKGWFLEMATPLWKAQVEGLRDVLRRVGEL